MKRKKGFTLVEVMAVITILLVLIMIMFVFLQKGSAAFQRITSNVDIQNEFRNAVLKIEQSIEHVPDEQIDFNYEGSLIEVRDESGNVTTKYIEETAKNNKNEDIKELIEIKNGVKTVLISDINKNSNIIVETYSSDSSEDSLTKKGELITLSINGDQAEKDKNLDGRSSKPYSVTIDRKLHKDIMIELN